MTDQNPDRGRTDREGSADPKYDNWPVEGEDENTRYIGFPIGSEGSPVLYQEAEDTVYEGEIDEENERIVLEEESAREIESGTSVTDVIESIADDVGWASLSEWAHEQRGTGPGQVDDVEFDRRNVAEDADHDYGFFGSYTYSDETDRVHIVERMFEVYTDPDRREDGNPVVVLEETHLVAEDPQADRRAGDADAVSRTTTELVPDVGSDTDTEYEVSTIHEWCREWHESHLERSPG